MSIDIAVYDGASKTTVVRAMHGDETAALSIAQKGMAATQAAFNAKAALKTSAITKLTSGQPLTVDEASAVVL